MNTTHYEMHFIKSTIEYREPDRFNARNENE